MRTLLSKLSPQPSASKFDNFANEVGKCCIGFSPRYSLHKLDRLPISGGKLLNSLLAKDKSTKLDRLPISDGRLVRLLPPKNKTSKLDRFHISMGKLLRLLPIDNALRFDRLPISGGNSVNPKFDRIKCLSPDTSASRMRSKTVMVLSWADTKLVDVRIRLIIS